MLSAILSHVHICSRCLFIPSSKAHRCPSWDIQNDLFSYSNALIHPCACRMPRNSYDIMINRQSHAILDFSGSRFSASCLVGERYGVLSARLYCIVVCLHRSVSSSASMDVLSTLQLVFRSAVRAESQSLCSQRPIAPRGTVLCAWRFPQ